MIYDLLDIQKDLVVYKGEDNNGKITEKKAILCDMDDVFRKYRFKHLAEVMSGIGVDVKEFLTKNAAA